MTLSPPARRPLLLALSALLLAGCTPTGGPAPGGTGLGAQPVSASLPPDAVLGAGDPTRTAILNTAYAFASPANLAGRPADAAQAVAHFEYLAVELPTGPRWREFSPLLEGRLAAGRAELRQAVGIAPDAPPQAVIDRLYAAMRAMRAGDAPAVERILAAPVFIPGGAATAQRLAALPALPATSVAAMHAQAELMRRDQPGGRLGFR